jgi:glycosyltransferase involved in cell wall biosynthesis
VTARPIVVVLSGFPRRSETFALAEVSALVDRGLLASVFSTKPGEAGPVQPAAARLAPRVRRLDGAPEDQAGDAARLLRGVPVGGVHAYFAHTPASVGASLAARLGVPFGFSVHARDARKLPRAELHARARQAACVVACNADVAREFDGSGARVRIVPHGVDLQRFATGASPRRDSLRLLAVGRLVEKKGFHVLLDALSHTPEPWQLQIVGEGPERDRLGMQAHALGVAQRVLFEGALTHETLPRVYAGADVIVVPSIVDSSGDRDGLPNVVLEAMASGRAIVGSETGAIASAIRDGESGLLVPAGDCRALAKAMLRLGSRPSLRAALGGAARRRAELDFDIHRCANRFVDVLQEAYA